MNLLRFKAPALVELVTPSAAPGIFTTALTRDVKVVNAFGFASSTQEQGSAFQIFSVAQGVRQNLTKQVELTKDVTAYVTDLAVDHTLLRSGWTLGIEVFGNTQASVYIWTIPLPRPGFG
jgi:hypothetical protein